MAIAPRALALSEARAGEAGGLEPELCCSFRVGVFFFLVLR